MLRWQAGSRWQPITGINDDDMLVDANFRVYHAPEQPRQPLPAATTPDPRPAASPAAPPVAPPRADEPLTDLELAWAMGQVSESAVFGYGWSRRSYEARTR